MPGRLISTSLLFISVLLIFGSGHMTSFTSKSNAKEQRIEQRAFAARDSLTFTGAYLSGQIASANNESNQAIAFYQRALELEPENTEVQRQLLALFLNTGTFDEAVKIAKNLRDDEEVSELAERVLAVQTIRNKEYHNTDRYLNLEKNNHLDFLINQLLSAWAKFGNNNKDEAVEQIAALKGPEWYAIFKDFNIGMMVAISGDKQQAIKHFNILITNENTARIAPDTYRQTIMALAILYVREGDKDKGLAVLNHHKNIHFESAIDTLTRQIISNEKLVFPVNNAQEGASEALFTLGGAINHEGNEDIVIRYLQYARALNPYNAAALVMLAGFEEQFEKPEKAIEIYRSVPKHSPIYRFSELQIGLNLAAMNKTDEALEHIAALIINHPQDMRAYQGYGHILSREKRYREMVDNFESAIKAIGVVHNSSHWNLFYQLGIGYERLKIWEKAEKAFLRSLELSPNQPQVMNYLGYSWIDMNINLSEGMDMIKNAVSLRPDDGYIIDSLGWAYYRQGQYEDAVRELERAVEHLPSDPTINDHLGDVLWKVGRKTEAYFQWKKALSNMAEFDESLVPVIEEKLENGLSEDIDEKTSH